MLPELFEGDTPAGMLACPFVIELIDDEDTVLIAQLDKLAAVGIVRGTDVVDAILLHQLDTLLDSPWIGGCT